MSHPTYPNTSLKEHNRKEGTQKQNKKKTTQELEEQDEDWETLSSERAVAIARINWTQLKLPAQCIHKIKPVNIPT